MINHFGEQPLYGSLIGTNGNSLVDDIPDWDEVICGPVYAYNGNYSSLFYRIDGPMECGGRTGLKEQVFSGDGLHGVSGRIAAYRIDTHIGTVPVCCFL